MQFKAFCNRIANIIKKKEKQFIAEQVEGCGSKKEDVQILKSTIFKSQAQGMGKIVEFDGILHKNSDTIIKV